VELVKRILSAEGWQQNDIAGVIERLRANPAVCEPEAMANSDG
jgi:transcriptional regulator